MDPKPSADHGGEPLVGIVQRPAQEGVEGLRAQIAAHHEGGIPAGAGHAGGDLGREMAGMEGHGQALLLQQPGGGEAHRPAAENCHRPLQAQGADAFQHEQGRAPGEGDARSSMAVVVQHRPAGDRLDAHVEPLGAVGPQADHPAHDAITGEGRNDGAERRRSLGRRNPGPSRAAERTQQQGGTQASRTCQELASGAHGDRVEAPG